MTKENIGAEALSAAFKQKKIFIPAITCGDPDLEMTAKCIKAAAKAGARIVEIDIPFSDPIAESPVIQASSLRALKAGMTTDLAFETVKKARQEYGVEVPIYFMAYANVVFTYGVKEFAKRCIEVGVQGVILPDVPFEEREEFSNVFDMAGIALISLIAPNSTQRIAMIAREARGFIYLISNPDMTQVRSGNEADIAEIASVIHKNTDVPFAARFGISTPEQATQMSQKSDGLIVGSAIMELIQTHGVDAPKFVEEYVAQMVAAL